jgi:hypothetical protein
MAKRTWRNGVRRDPQPVISQGSQLFTHIKFVSSATQVHTRSISAIKTRGCFVESNLKYQFGQIRYYFRYAMSDKIMY